VQTAFVRPGQFRFEFQDSIPLTRYIIWRDGEYVQTWWTIMSPQLRKPPSFGLAIAGATGVSGSSACRVPKLLLTSQVGGKQGRGNDSDRGRRHRWPRFLSIPGATSTVGEIDDA
jgi:hypothetical protein